jgi:hypothetical protein
VSDCKSRWAIWGLTEIIGVWCRIKKTMKQIDCVLTWE